MIAISIVGVRSFSVGAQLNASKKSIRDKTGKNIVLVDGVRTPFLLSGTTYANLMPHDLAREALAYVCHVEVY